MLPKNLLVKLNNRQANDALRQLSLPEDLIDFSSNDYLGFAKSELIFQKVHHHLISNNIKQNGATGSRLLSGNHRLYKVLESHLKSIHKTESALVFNSGYDANLGIFSSIPQRGDTILYDELIHASIRDGINMSNSKSYKFKHNDLEHLEKLVLQNNSTANEIYIVTESVFSMDGDSPDLNALVALANKYNCYLIIDEAHALGVFGYGLVQHLNLEKEVFIRLITFSKALGCHGAVILSGEVVKDYLINFSRPFIYTTALPPHSLATIIEAYKELEHTMQMEALQSNIKFFNSELVKHNLELKFIPSNSAIHCCIIPGNNEVKCISEKIKLEGYNVKPILSPTVPLHSERLRICLHSYNSKHEISEILRLIATFTNS